MSFADDLLELSRHLANLEPIDPHQASLRRAVSTAYYALFHLLISEATLNWNRPEFRPALGRIFEHGKMKSASEDKRRELDSLKKSTSEPELTTLRHLHTVVNRFIRAQQKRHDADYDTAVEWTRTDVLTQIEAVSNAFNSWRIIRDEPIAQEFLVSLLGKRRRPPID